MKRIAHRRDQEGVALVVSMIFLLVVTVISVVAANNSRQGLVMTTNLQDGNDSFQSAEAGLIAALSTARTADDLFDGTSTPNIFSALTDVTSPLGELNHGNAAMDVDVIITAYEQICPTDETPDSEGYVIQCDYYRIESEHRVDRKARTKLAQGIVKTFPK